MDFNPILRMVVMSDTHFHLESEELPKRLTKGMKCAYDYADKSNYKKIDAVYVVGDFADRGFKEEMEMFRDCLNSNLRAETESVLMLASHEFMSDGVEAAYEKFKAVFNKKTENHLVFNGFHCISVSCDKGCRLNPKKVEWVNEQLEIAAKDDPRKPIFMFQHPHLSDTVYGSINWGEDDLIPTLMNYPQIVDFSGHSHAPINDPRSVHQKYFTSFGTGSLYYFELDEFDKFGGTVPSNSHDCAQFLIVEADAQNRVLVKPFDILSGHFFNDGCLIETPWDPESFTYTDKRYVNPETPFFPENTTVTLDKSEDKYFLTFTAAKGISERIDSYTVVVRKKSDSLIVRQVNETSSYYLYSMPDKMSMPLGKLPKGNYVSEIYANGFWKNSSEKLTFEFEVC